ncbi:hypothetical protein EO087_14010 [Dyella sp. M7H15-1]|uniref:hypothetical protein n=1 Tax=Dyella sp. M7H15-1 TaxID=2501295 RepID=UPI001004EB20|nr:hypothetical protein [Dyella sp. M7H15-1]QAU24971.1 hypothetical protein EO087_14010 [Dyella sp. M7H15-1]
MHITSFQRFFSGPSHIREMDYGHAVDPHQHQSKGETVLDAIKNIFSFGITSFYEAYRMDARKAELDTAINDMLMKGSGLNVETNSDIIILYRHTSHDDPYELVLKGRNLVAMHPNGDETPLRTFASQNEYKVFLSDLCNTATSHGALRDEVRDKLILSNALNDDAINSIATHLPPTYWHDQIGLDHSVSIPHGSAINSIATHLPPTYWHDQIGLDHSVDIPRMSPEETSLALRMNTAYKQAFNKFLISEKAAIEEDKNKPDGGAFEQRYTHFCKKIKEDISALFRQELLDLYRPGSTYPEKIVEYKEPANWKKEDGDILKPLAWGNSSVETLFGNMGFSKTQHGHAKFDHIHPVLLWLKDSWQLPVSEKHKDSLIESEYNIAEFRYQDAAHHLKETTIPCYTEYREQKHEIDTRLARVLNVNGTLCVGIKKGEGKHEMLESRNQFYLQ